jgi:hypothetical protein
VATFCHALFIKFNNYGANINVSSKDMKPPPEVLPVEHASIDIEPPTEVPYL